METSLFTFLLLVCQPHDQTQCTRLVRYNLADEDCQNYRKDALDYKLRFTVKADCIEQSFIDINR